MKVVDDARTASLTLGTDRKTHLSDTELTILLARIRRNDALLESYEEVKKADDVGSYIERALAWHFYNLVHEREEQ